MKVNGKKIKLKKEYFYGKLEINMMENGKVIKKKEKEHFIIKKIKLKLLLEILKMIK